MLYSPCSFLSQVGFSGDSSDVRNEDIKRLFIEKIVTLFMILLMDSIFSFDSSSSSFTAAVLFVQGKCVKRGIPK